MPGAIAAGVGPVALVLTLAWKLLSLAHVAYRHHLSITRVGEGLVLVSVPTPGISDPRLAGLSWTERAVAELAVRGLSNAAIAEARRTSTRTVANQLAAVYKKVGALSRRELRALWITP
jgi:DNA-binding NarL/FixJ family response regulator